MVDRRRTLRILFFAVILLVLIGCMDESVWIKRQSGAAGEEVVVGKEGFWRLMRDTNGVWWFLSPEGKLEFLNTVTTVQPHQKGQDENGPHYISKDWKGGLERKWWGNEFEMYNGEFDYWAERTIKRVKDAGFKALGGWCNRVFHRHDVTITQFLGIWRWAGNGTLFYSPEWADKAREAIEKKVPLLCDNRNLVGYYLDNELGWAENFSSAERYFNGLETDNPNRREVVKVIRSVWAGIEEFNEDWECDLQDWSELDNLAKLPREPASARRKLQEAWLYHLARDYFEFATKLIRKYDKNHLIMGVRFKGRAPREVCRASRGLTDAQSTNMYHSDAKLGAEMFDGIYEESGQPVIITEYGFHSTDGRSGNKNRCGFIWGHVIDQEAKADGYRLLTTRFARVPYIIGADWFQWNDEPPSGRGDGEDVNFGIVDIHDEPYEHMVEVIRETTPQLNYLHARSFGDEGEDIWQKVPAERAVFKMPYLDEPVVVDGELCEWTVEAKLADLQYLEAVGIERADELVMPAVYLGWRDDGIYLGLEVFDKNVDGYVLNEETMKHMWRSRSFDCVEVWLSTRPVEEDRNLYDQYCHDFMLIPEGDGTVMQWHHSGDMLEENLVPHPDVKCTFKSLSDRYVVEMFIPSKALNGFEPQAYPVIAGNIFIRNWQPRIDWYWACNEFGAPGEWGRMKLSE
ncbi:MAG: hypothetical protein JSV82_01595 [Planctomycetota bacterium]|nr:MAG: hypothetical protein JSV82_01595 [Planctomycetota bacterium]